MWEWIKSLFRKKPVEIPVENPIEKPVEKPTVLFGSKEWLAAEYARATVDQAWLKETNRAVAEITKNMLRYKAVETKTGVPYWVVACIHYRESSMKWNACLHNGDPLGKVTVRVPAGRGPFHTWEDAAVDALKYDGSDKNKDWSVGGALDFMQRYNGMGYARRGLHSCYLFSCTSVIHKKGRYTYDGFFNPLARTDDYLGVVCIMKGLGIK